MAYGDPPDPFFDITEQKRKKQAGNKTIPSEGALSNYNNDSVNL